MIIDIDTDSHIPPYEQLRAQVETMIASGVLPVGFRLPSIRQLAGDLGLAPGTAARAYRELESAGVVESRAGRGTAVAAAAAHLSERNRQRRLLDAARAYSVAVAQLGASPAQALAAVAEQLSPGLPKRA